MSKINMKIYLKNYNLVVRKAQNNFTDETAF